LNSQSQAEAKVLEKKPVLAVAKLSSSGSNNIENQAGVTLFLRWFRRRNVFRRCQYKFSPITKHFNSMNSKEACEKLLPLYGGFDCNTRENIFCCYCEQIDKTKENNDKDSVSLSKSKAS
jgi:hypothetical protein